MRAASLKAAYADTEPGVSGAAVEAARSVAAAAACAAARSAMTALQSSGKPAESFWENARSDFQQLLNADLGQPGTVGRAIPQNLFKPDA